MKILMLVNWKVRHCDRKPSGIQPPDYCVAGEDYWFYRYFREKPEVDVVDITSFRWLENIEKETIRFYPGVYEIFTGTDANSFFAIRKVTIPE